MEYCKTRVAPKCGSSSVELPENLVEQANVFFVEVGQRTVESVRSSAPLSEEDVLPCRVPRVCAARFQLQPVTLVKLERALMSMNNGGCCGCDGRKVDVMKVGLPVLGETLLDIINCSFVTSTVPSKWKISPLLGLFTKPMIHLIQETSDPFI